MNEYLEFITEKFIELLENNKDQYQEFISVYLHKEREYADRFFDDFIDTYERTINDSETYKALGVGYLRIILNKNA